MKAGGSADTTRCMAPFGLTHLAAARRRVGEYSRTMTQIAVAAVAAWYAATALLSDPRPAFASIAAVIALGAAHGRRERAVQLTCGVVLGITVADLLVQLIGTGPPQMGLMVILAMAAARALGGGEVLVSEAAVSAILLAAIDPSAGGGFTPHRMLEAAIGGAVALAVSSLVLPHDPVLDVGRATQSVFDRLGLTLGRLAAALDDHSLPTAEEALVTARSIDELVRELDEAVATGRETVRLAPPRP